MATSIYEVETEDGVYEVEVDDGGQSSGDSSIPNSGSTNEKISAREDILSGLMGKIKSNPLDINPASNAMNAMNLVGGVGQRGEAVIANLLGEVQKGSQMQSILNSAVEGAKGNVLGQYGDLIRRTGVGGEYNEALASTTGLLASLATLNAWTGGKLLNEAGKLKTEVAKDGSKFLTQVEQAAKDAITNKTGFLEDMRSAFYEAKDSAVQKFGQGLEKLAEDNPTTKVNLRPVIDELNQSIALDPKVRNAVSKVQGLSVMLDNPKLANKVDLKEAQNIVNMVQSRVSSGKLQGVGVRPDDIPLLDVIHDMKYQMVDAFPQLKEVRKGYADVIQKFNALRGKFKVGRLETSVKNNMGDAEEQKMVKELLNESPDILSRLKGYATLRRVGKLASQTAVGSAAVGGVSLLSSLIKR